LAVLAPLQSRTSNVDIRDCYKRPQNVTTIVTYLLIQRRALALSACVTARIVQLTTLR